MLLYTVWNGYKAVIELLLEKGVRISVEDQSWGTPLPYAI